MIGKLMEERSLTSVAESFGIKKLSFRTLRKPSKPLALLLERLVVAAMEKQLQSMTYIVLQAKRAAPLLGNSVQHQDDQCLSLLWSDAFTNVAYSASVMNASSL
ncbi:hypothetical protein TNCV_1800601 [Trichonephila clavipes]|nr:hypothetical protein TNCV_1800601 [Trichonephila clavipes]